MPGSGRPVRKVREKGPKDTGVPPLIVPGFSLGSRNSPSFVLFLFSIIPHDPSGYIPMRHLNRLLNLPSLQKDTVIPE